MAPDPDCPSRLSGRLPLRALPCFVRYLIEIIVAIPARIQIAPQGNRCGAFLRSTAGRSAFECMDHTPGDRADSEEGVSVRHIGVFRHRGLSLDARRIEPGACHQVPAARALRSLFVTEGSGTIGGEELRRWSAARLKPGESTTVIATSPLELLEIAVRPVGDLTTGS